jgi:predicted RNase H-like HicB family nuclease
LCRTADATRHGIGTGGVTLKFTVTLEKDEDGFFLVSCPALVGCHSQGKTREEALANIKEAIRGYVASLRKHGEPIPTPQVEEVEVAI